MTLAPLVAGAAGRPVLSFELFPPRSESAREGLWRKLSDLLAARPDFVSVTFGAAGATRGPSRDLLAHVLRTTAVPAMAHLTCVGSSRREVVDLASEFLDAGVRNVLALRGDPPAGDAGWTPHPDGVATARDLVELLQVADRRRAALRGARVPVDEGPLSLAVAAFPRGGEGELAALRAKQDAGADFAVCQVTFSAGEYAAFVRRARAAGVRIPLLPGVAVTDCTRRLGRIGELTGVPVPVPLLAALDTDDAPRRRRAATAFTAGLARGLLDAGAPGVHLYTFNAAEPALDLLDDLDLPRSLDPIRASTAAAAGGPAR
ncbi:methylenetetrahydrofolate reductase [Kineococcus radiotolerans]|uniref:Methylenetetrahydrofolate reductase n=1 Tax=Kineococcus radiotolerans (strain ATCC BAA-149 / DSM 14245 / SRS30216) TaxID=266940 RepID=A6W6I5_KINRD|nr:methylenetetrahydrofolate reductase [Kineococcus radiotolerans]ABS02424.1 Methylenetetrahydrofolate reductase (NAD(P)H) [Kineococcus radiotolerans SRS30216 = ATCC BAA-149]